MNAEIINIGDELLIGQVINSNASWLGEQLNKIGVAVKQVSIISDQQDQILETLKDAEKRVDIILITGGLGPTKDDITKQTLCNFFNTKLIFHQPTYEDVEKLFHSRGLKVKEINRKQAEIPENCIPIRNTNGTAPGMWFEKDGKIIVSMPGVPYEMKPMITDFVIPKLVRQFDTHIIYHKTILTQGMGESSITEIINDWENNLPANFKLAYLPQPGIVRLRLTATGDNLIMIRKEVENQVRELQRIIPDLIFGYDNDMLEEIIGRLLKEKGLSLATAESCTGGYIAHLITSIPGSSVYFTGSLIAYSNKIKETVLGVKEETLKQYGAVSKQTVVEMAEGVRKLYGTDYAIAVSGIAGPEGGTPQKPVGTTWIAISSPHKTHAQKFLFGEHRGRNIRKAAVTALNELRKVLAKETL